jgi:hypothetical protein
MMLNRSFLLLAFSALATAFTTRSSAFLGSNVRYVERKILPFVLRLLYSSLLYMFLTPTRSLLRYVALLLITESLPRPAARHVWT